MKRIVVTGGSGKTGRAVVEELLAHGHEVVNVDRLPPAQPLFERKARFLHAELVDFGQAVEALAGADAVVHLAAIPAPGLRPPEATFRENTLSTFNVFQAAALHGLRRVVWASSETVLGLPFEAPPPSYAPVDEEHPLLPQTAYSLSKVMGEAMAPHFARWRPGTAVVGLRLSNVMEPEDYGRFPSFWGDPLLRKWNLWGYIDARDAAQGCRLALTAPIEGAETFVLAAAETVMTTPSAELMARVFPRVPLRRPVAGHETLLSIEKARRLLGYRPAHRWRDHVSPPS